MDIPRFRYMAWAKAHSDRGAYPLHLSGIPAVTLEDLGVSPSSLRLGRPNPFPPDPEVAAAVAARYGVPAECVMPVGGTHLANYLAARTLVEPGIEILVETPTYEDLPGVFALAGAVVRPLRREPGSGWRLPIPEIRTALRAGARGVVLSDLHNPGGARLLPDDLAALEAAGREFDAFVLVDEVYRDFLPPPVGTCFVPGGPFVVTSSLTKVYGLGGLRIGWALAAPGIVAKMRDLHDYLVVNLPAPSASIALAAWGNLDAVAARHRERAAKGLRRVAAWVRERRDLRWTPPEAGISGYVECEALRGRDDVAWVEGLIEATGVAVVPGSMFDAPPGFRVAWGLPEERLAEGLRLLGGYLDRGTKA
jgi:aspartate/methionine/tyrosine aminotransferase